ncbi:hypothetical protein C4D60_Mb05t10330 [Musa balbisiana]|uniref:Ubiquitin-like domain-containing protein n=1 Tax=Musa balbisiana TaxID=52838 RepID=A0A4S8JV40_MUSBA|nr:hypothetical protein C4D60_Mb05t10330 [Musa balbisiana]
MEGAKDAGGDRSTITVQVKFSGRTLPVSLPMDATVADLKSLLQPVTNVLTRGQTLICKGAQFSYVCQITHILGKGSLTTLPSAVGTLTSLCQLHIANNKITSLPDELGLLNQLQILKVANNRLSSMPSSIGNCRALVEIDLSCNLLVDLPETVGNLQDLKALILRNNGLKSLPPTLFKTCYQLSTLDLHGTEITNDFLRQIEGWEDFDERRRSKHQKQLDFRVGSSGVFDEGADDDRALK